jgi:CheY-like chemotaxis protein
VVGVVPEEPVAEVPLTAVPPKHPSEEFISINTQAVDSTAAMQSSSPSVEEPVAVPASDPEFETLAPTPTSTDKSHGQDSGNSAFNSRDFIELTPSAMDIALGSKADLQLRADGSPRKVLIVDDSPTVCKIVSITLKKRGFQVATAGDGVEAMSMISADRPDLILLDITMPRMDGYQLCKLIKGYPETKNIPVVMLSGKDGFFDRVRGKLVGCSDYITKPFDPELLVATVERFLPVEVAVQ